MMPAKPLTNYFPNCEHEVSCSSKIRPRLKPAFIKFRKRMKDEFIEFPDAPCLQLTDFESIVSIGRHKAKWLCSSCGKEYTSLLYNRYNRESDCIFCRQAPKDVLQIKPDRQIKNTNPSLSLQMVDIPSMPLQNPQTMLSSSAQIANWKCNCGVIFSRPIRGVVDSGTAKCSTCSRVGKSRFEFEVGCLLSIVVNETILFHHKKFGLPAVDLYLEGSDTAIQLDPFWSHQNKVESDIRITKKHQEVYARVLRFRQNPLPVFSDSVAVFDSDFTALIWAKAIASKLGLKFQITEERKNKELTRANKLWDSANDLDFDDHQVYIKEFISNITHPGRYLTKTPGQSADVCKWKCSFCLEQWEEKVSNKNNKNRLGCPLCIKKQNKLNKRRPEIKNTFFQSKNAITNFVPQLKTEFVKNTVYPNSVFEDLSKTCTDIVLWECSFCHVQWEAMVSARLKGKLGCKTCRAYMSLEPEKSIKVLNPELAALVVHGFQDFIKAENITPNSHQLALWKCSTCDVGEVTMPVSTVLKYHNERGSFPQCVTCKPTRNKVY